MVANLENKKVRRFQAFVRADKLDVSFGDDLETTVEKI